jgi:hypothetical protein
VADCELVEAKHVHHTNLAGQHGTCGEVTTVATAG